MSEPEGVTGGPYRLFPTKIVRAAWRSVPPGPFGPVLPSGSQGRGRALVCHALRQAQDLGHRAAVILGDPVLRPLRLPRLRALGPHLTDGKTSPGLMALELEPGARPGVSGRFP